MEVHLKFYDYSTSLQTVLKKLTQTHLELNAFGVCHPATTTTFSFSCKSAPNFCLATALHSIHWDALSFLSVFPVVKHFTGDIIFKSKATLYAEETGDRASGRKRAVSEMCVRYQQSIETKIIIYEN